MLILVKSLFISGRIKKKVVGDATKVQKKPPSPGNSSTAVHDDDHDDGNLARLERFVAGVI